MLVKEDEEKISVRDFIMKLDEKMELLNMKEEMAERYLMKVSPVVKRSVTKSCSCSC